jgi:hypothetical protein
MFVFTYFCHYWSSSENVSNTINILSRVGGVRDFRRCLGWMIGLLTPYSFNSGLQAMQCYRCLHTLEFTVTQAQFFGVF